MKTITRRRFCRRAAIITAGLSLGMAGSPLFDPFAKALADDIDEDPYVHDGDEYTLYFDEDDDSFIRDLDSDPDSEESPIDWIPEIDDDEIDDLFPEDSTDNWVPYDEDSANGTVGILAEVLAIAFEKIATGAMESIGSHLGDEAWSLVFGDETAESLMEIEAKLDAMAADIQQILSILQQEVYTDQLDEYMNDYAIPIDSWLAIQSNIRAQQDAEPDPDERARLQQEWAVELLQVDSKYKVFDNKTVDQAVLQVANALLQTSMTSGTNIVGAYDGLMLISYKWEHLTYELRESFQQYILGQFLMLAAYAQFALRVNIDMTKDDPDRKSEFMGYVAVRDALFWNGINDESDDYADDEDYLEAYAYLTGGYDRQWGAVVSVQDMYENQQCVRREPSLRYYQVPGHEKLFAATIRTVNTEAKARNNQKQLMYDSAGHRVVTGDELKMLLGDYGGGKTLDDILYSEDEGCFEKPDNWMNWRYINFGEFTEKAVFYGYDEGYHFETDVDFTRYDGQRYENTVYWRKRTISGGWEGHVIDSNYNCLYVIE